MITDKQIEKYRNAECEICRGEGVLVDWDWVPYGSTNVRMETSEVCECVVIGMDVRDEIVEALGTILDNTPGVTREQFDLIIEEFADENFKFDKNIFGEK